MKIQKMLIGGLVVALILTPIMILEDHAEPEMRAGAGLADTPWPMFRHDLRHTGRSSYLGPEKVNLLWELEMSDWGVFSSPSIGPDGTIYLQTRESGSDLGLMYAIDSRGNVLWIYETEAPSWSSAAVAEDGTIYFGARHNYLYALTSQGALKWKFETIGGRPTSPAVASDGTIYVGDCDYPEHKGRFYAIDHDGNEIWTLDIDGWVISAPAVDVDGTVYFGTDEHWYDGRVYAMNPDGTVKWTFLDIGRTESSPAIGDDGTIYIGSRDRSLHAIYPNGTLRWSFPTGDIVDSSPAIGEDGTIYVGSCDGNLYAVYPNGTERWRYTTGDCIYWSSPAIDSGGNVYIGSDDGNLYAIDSSGSLKWAFETGDSINGPSPTIGCGGSIYIASGDGKLYAIEGSATCDHEVGLRVTPRTLNLKSNGRWITARLSLNESPMGIDVSSILLQGCLTPERWTLGNESLMLKFNRQELIAMLEVGDSVQIKLSGKWEDGTAFEAYDCIRVINPGKK